MSTKNFRQWMLAMVMALSIVGIYGYRTIVKERQEICVIQTKEGQEKKLKSSALPMWESLSRHLIMDSRY